LPRLILSAVVTTALVLSAGTACALESSLTKQSSMPPDVVWKKIGDFCGITTWIPVVDKCFLTQDGKFRIILLAGGGGVVEHLDNWDDANRSYSYTIVFGTPPLDDYHSTLSVSPDGSGSVVKWRGTYKAKGTSDEEAKKLIDGVYEAGTKKLLGQ
jgi:Polyketide cyclase / dehydrase and lipid transport